MKLERTVVIPTDDPDLARELFQNLVYKEAILLVVVLGKTDKAKRAVECADQCADAVIAGFKRKVVWIREPDILSNELASLKPGRQNLADTELDRVVAFSVSLADSVMDIVTMDDTIDFVRMEMAFLKAGEK